MSYFGSSHLLPRLLKPHSLLWGGRWPKWGPGWIPGCSDPSLCPIVGEMPQASQVLPSSGPAMQSLPKSPERPGSTSPFAPSAADLPGMPEPALTSRANMTGKAPRGLVRLTGSRTEALGEGIVSIWSLSHRDREVAFMDKTRQGGGGLQGVEGIGTPMFPLAFSYLPPRTKPDPVWPDLLNCQQHLQISVFT